MISSLVKLFKNDNKFKCFKCEHGNKQVKSRSYKGIRPIEVGKVKGSVDRCRGENNVKINQNSSRYQNIKEAIENLEKLPPIEVYDVDGEYYVIDGHHRVVASKEIGRDFIDAKIIEYQFNGKKAS